MTPAEMTALLDVLQSFATILGDMGLPGLIGMLLLGPALVLVLILYMNHLATVRMEKGQAGASVRMEKGQAEFRKSTSELLEAYRQDTHEIMQVIGTKHDNITRLHENAIAQIKSTEQHNAILHTLVVNNTTAMEQLKSIITTIANKR